MKSILNNLPLKILALLSASVFWVLIIYLQNAPYQFNDEIEIKALNLSENITLSEPLPKAKIRIVAKKEYQSQISKNDFDVYVDLRNAGEGELKYEVFASSKNENVRIFDVQPKEVTVKLEEAKEKSLPVKVAIFGKPSEGFMMKNNDIAPREIKIKGPKKLIEKAQKVLIRANLSGKENETFTRKMTGEIVDEKEIPVPGLKLEEEVTVVFNIEALKTKEVEVKITYRGRLKKGTLQNLKISPLKIMISGTQEALDNVSFMQTKAIDLSTISSNTKITVELNFPPGITSDQKTVDVQLTVQT